jgi:hypothetical protein
MLITFSTYIFKEKRYESRNTKSPQLAFRALLDGDGARDVSFERVLAGYP